MSRHASSGESPGAVPEPRIHPTAIIHPDACLHETVVVGPYAVIDEAVVIGPSCRVGPQVHLTGQTTIGAGNVFHTGCVVGDAPQDLKYSGAPTRLRIGDLNTFREHVIIHRANRVDDDTIIGSRNYFMAHSHVGHNARLGDEVILANGVLVAGHVVIDDRAFISGNCVIHQFVRVGTLAMMQGGSAISKDLPPYTMARGDNGICGLNIVGLRRAGFNGEQRLELRRLYRGLFRGRLNLRQAVAAARLEFFSEPARIFLDFVAATRRGICADTGRRGAQIEEEGPSD